MIPQEEMVDHREHVRYRVPKDSFVTIGSDEPILGQIMDISMGGIAFRYMDSKKPTDESRLDMFLTEGDMCLGQVPIKAVSDYEIPNTVLCKTVDEIPPSCRTMRRCGVQFGDLTQHQRSQLQHYIQNHTTGIV
jgi:c-di-GMP-binding flagellar brake protein YcgR